jgi:hypothetical protein
LKQLTQLAVRRRLAVDAFPRIPLDRKYPRIESPPPRRKFLQEPSDARRRPQSINSFEVRLPFMQIKVMSPRYNTSSMRV